MKVFCLILGSLFIFSCYSQGKNELTPRRTVIAGVVNNFSDKANVLVVNFCDPINKNELQFAQNLIETNGYFRAEHEYIFAQNITIRFANRFINLFVHPGDSIFISIDANEIQNNLDNAIEFSNDNADLNKELFVWTNYLYHNYNPQFDNNSPPEDFLRSVAENFKLAQDSIKAYSLRTSMSNFLQKWAFIDYKFITANSLMDYDNPKANKWDVFTDSIFDVFNEDNFQTMYFQYHLGVCMNALIQSEVEIERLFSEKDYILAIQLTLKKISQKAPQGTVRDVMLFNFLKNIIEDNPQLYDSIPEIKTAFSQSFFNNELEKSVEKSEKPKQAYMVSETEKSLTGIWQMTNNEIEKLPDAKLLNYLLEIYENKVLYIDVWATWCGPCIKEFEFTPNLHKHFKDKDVVFINLCLESKIESWEQSVAKNNVSGNNYFLDDNASKLFRAENNLPGFPSYLIIDKKGKIHNPVPRPSDLESAIQKIESCLD